MITLKEIQVSFLVCIASSDIIKDLGVAISINGLERYGYETGKMEITQRITILRNRAKYIHYNNFAIQTPVLLKRGNVRFLIRNSQNQINLNILATVNEYLFVQNYIHSFIDRPVIMIIDDALIKTIERISSMYKHEIDLAPLIKELEQNRGRLFINSRGNENWKELGQCIE